MGKMSMQANAPIDENASCTERGRSGVSPYGAVCSQFRYLTNSWALFAKLLVGVFVVTAIAAPVRAQTVTEILQHEWIAHPEVFGYVEYEGSLFYGEDARLYRLDSLDSEPIELPLPTPPGWSSPSPLFATFIEFDGALFFHALRRNEIDDGWYGSGSYLHRISGRFGQPELIDIPEEPSTPAFDWIDDQRGYADNTGGFAVYDGSLYFFASRAIPVPVLPGAKKLGSALFRLDSADSIPQQVDWLDYVTQGQRAGSLSATRAGLLFRTEGAIQDDRTSWRDGRVYLIEQPGIVSNVNAIDPPESPSYAITSGAAPFGFGGVTEFNGSIFYAGQHGGFHESPDVPDVGPFPRPEDYAYTGLPRQIELYRYNRKSGFRYFDLHSITEREAIDSWNPADGNTLVGSSSPSNFVVADDVFYFTANPNGATSIRRGDSQLYRMTSANSTPEHLSFSPQAPEVTPRVFGEFGGRTWFWTDTGTGPQVHYLTEDGTGAVPLQLPVSLPSDALVGGFVEYGDNVVFWVWDTRQDLGEISGWTYAVSFNGPDGPQPPAKPLSTTLLANNDEYPDRPGLIARVGERVTLRCDVTNHSDAAFANVRIRIVTDRHRSHKNAEQAGRSKRRKEKACRYGSIASGGTRSCTVAVSVRPGTHRYTCRTLGQRDKKTEAKSSDSVYLSGRRPTKGTPKK